MVGRLASNQMKWLSWSVLSGMLVFYGYVTYWGSISLHAAGPLTEIVSLEDSAEGVFYLVGDTGMGNQAQLDVAQAMEAECVKSGSPRGLMLLGDNIYQRGIDSPDSEEMKTKFELPYSSPCLSQVPVYPVLGNHDHKGNPEAQVAYSQRNPRWHMPGRMYSVRFGNVVEFFAIDTNFLDLLIPTPDGYRGHISRALRTSPAKWKLALGHHPHESGCSDRPYREDPIRGYATENLLCGHADAYVGGHMHFMERVDEPDSCLRHSFIAGSGGAPLRAFDQPQCKERTKFAASQHGFLKLTARSSQLTWEFIDTKGGVLHTYNQTASLENSRASL